MWDCGINYGMGNWFLGGGIFGITLKILIILGIFALLYRLLWPNSKKILGSNDRVDSLEIIKMRLSKGEISEQEYKRIKDILNK
jgi:putative membrane protein